MSGYPMFLVMAVGALVGSATHCSVMCAPAVAAQMMMMPTHDLRAFLISYHAGRIGTYMMLGGASVLLQQWVFGGSLAELSAVILVVAGAVFVASAVFPAKTHSCCKGGRHKVQQWIGRLRFMKLQYLLRGVLIGFMPCGMLLSALLLVGTLPSAIHAAALMLVFGLATVPMLQAAAFPIVSLGRRNPWLRPVLGRIALAANGAILCGIGLNIVHIS